MSKCGKNCEVFSRVVGYYRPVQFWNEGKQKEFEERKPYSEQKSLASELRLNKTTIMEFAKCEAPEEIVAEENEEEELITDEKVAQ